MQFRGLLLYAQMQQSERTPVSSSWIAVVTTRVLQHGGAAGARFLRCLSVEILRILWG